MDFPSFIGCVDLGLPLRVRPVYSLYLRPILLMGSVGGSWPHLMHRCSGLVSLSLERFEPVMWLAMPHGEFKLFFAAPELGIEFSHHHMNRRVHVIR